MLDQTTPGTIIDVGAHSLGTSLLTQAYETDETLQDRVRQSYLFNPAMSPFAENVTAKYEADDRVRYFIDLMDPVSVGGIGETGPSNVVYRTDWSFNPLVAHSVSQWGGAEMPEMEEEKEKDKVFDPFDGAVDTGGLDQKGLGDALGEGVLLDFGDGFDATAFGF